MTKIFREIKQGLSEMEAFLTGNYPPKRKENFFQDVFETISLKIHNEIAWLKKSFEYAKFLREDRDYDYGYLLELMKFKMKRMAVQIQHNDLVVSNKRVARQLNYACFLLEKLQAGPHELLPEKKSQLDKKWDDMFITEEGVRLVKRKRVFSPQKDEQFSKELVGLYLEQRTQFDKLKRRFFRHMERYLEHWWD